MATKFEFSDKNLDKYCSEKVIEIAREGRIEKPLRLDLVVHVACVSHKCNVPINFR